MILLLLYNFLTKGMYQNKFNTEEKCLQGKKKNLVEGHLIIIASLETE